MLVAEVLHPPGAARAGGAFLELVRADATGGAAQIAARRADGTVLSRQGFTWSFSRDMGSVPLDANAPPRLRYGFAGQPGATTAEVYSENATDRVSVLALRPQQRRIGFEVAAPAGLRATGAEGGPAEAEAALIFGPVARPCWPASPRRSRCSGCRSMSTPASRAASSCGRSSICSQRRGLWA